MSVKLLAAVLIIFGCGGIGLGMSRNCRHQIQTMEQFIRALEWMICDLHYRMPPLSILLTDTAEQCRGPTAAVLRQLASELENQMAPQVSVCMERALQAVPEIPACTASHLRALGTSLGQLDLHGQISTLEAEIVLSKRDLDNLSNGAQTRIRNYHTLSLCAGAVLVIVLI